MTHQMSRNVLKFTPQGFKNEISVQFPDGRLAVCASCKNNFKTRQSCRINNAHTDPPWSTEFVCVSIDPSAIQPNGKSYINQKLVAVPSRWRPYEMRRGVDLETPVCCNCKKINHARKFCRERHKHRELPWSTVYVRIYPSPHPQTLTHNADVLNCPTTHSQSNESSSSKISSESSSGANDIMPKNNSVGSKESAVGFSGIDDITTIQESRTFLVGISSKKVSLQWVDLPLRERTLMLEKKNGLSPPQYNNYGVCHSHPLQENENIVNSSRQNNFQSNFRYHVSSQYPDCQRLHMGGASQQVSPPLSFPSNDYHSYYSGHQNLPQPTIQTLANQSHFHSSSSHLDQARHQSRYSDEISYSRSRLQSQFGGSNEIMPSRVMLNQNDPGLYIPSNSPSVIETAHGARWNDHTAHHQRNSSFFNQHCGDDIGAASKPLHSYTSQPPYRHYEKKHEIIKEPNTQNSTFQLSSALTSESMKMDRRKQ